MSLCLIQMDNFQASNQEPDRFVNSTQSVPREVLTIPAIPRFPDPY